MEDLAEEQKAKLLEVQARAHAPYSQFQVAAGVQSRKSGKWYYGCNVENATFGATICAERAAICSLISEEGSQAEVGMVLILSPKNEPISPCGICRQSILEFSSLDTEVQGFSNDFSLEKKWTVGELIPDGFKFERSKS